MTNLDNPAILMTVRQRFGPFQIAEVAVPEDTEQVQVRGVSLYPVDWATVESVAKDSGATTSAALRLIIREWVRMKATEVSIVLQEHEEEAT